MSTAGIGRVLQRIDEIQSRIKAIIGPIDQNKTFEESLEEAQNNSEPQGSKMNTAPEEIKPLIQSASQRYNIPYNLLESVLYRESGFNSRAVSPKGAMGLMQIMPDTQKLLGITEPFDPAQSIDGGAKYLRMMIDRFGGDIRKALAAYNAGPEAVSRYNGIPPYKETQDYVSKILSDIGSFENE